MRIRDSVTKIDIKPSWVDLPPTDYLHLIPSIEKNRSLSALISGYHKLKKDDLNNINRRCSFLMEIIANIDLAYICNEFTDRALLNIQEISLRKSEYLKILKCMHDSDVLIKGTDVYNKDKISLYFETPTNSKYDCCILKNDLKYDSQNAYLWGEHWLEVVDPCHRPLDSYKCKWLQDNTNKPFFMWLENYQVPADHKHSVFINDGDISHNELKLNNGLIYKGNTLFTTSTHEENLFIIKPDLKIFSCINGKNYNHLSLSHGKPLLGSGTIKVNKGVTIELQSESGHYLPGKKFSVQLIKILDQEGLNMADSTPFTYFDEDTLIKTTIGLFRQETMSKHIANHNIKKLGFYK